MDVSRAKLLGTGTALAAFELVCSGRLLRRRRPQMRTTSLSQLGDLP
jgi:hypothetical protein